MICENGEKEKEIMFGVKIILGANLVSQVKAL